MPADLVASLEYRQGKGGNRITVSIQMVKTEHPAHELGKRVPLVDIPQSSIHRNFVVAEKSHRLDHAVKPWMIGWKGRVGLLAVAVIVALLAEHDRRQQICLGRQAAHRVRSKERR